MLREKRNKTVSHSLSHSQKTAVNSGTWMFNLRIPIIRQTEQKRQKRYIKYPKLVSLSVRVHVGSIFAHAYMLQALKLIFKF